jgi:hypothetical protein
LLHISPTLCEYSFGNELKALVNTPSTQASWWSLTGMQVTEWRDGIDAATIAQNFGVGLDTAKWTLKATMQRGVRSVLNPTCSLLIFQTNDWQLQYRWLAVDVFTDMMFVKVKSRCQNTCAQVFTMANGFTQAYPMAGKSQVHEALSLFH